MATPPPETDLYIGRDVGNYRIESLLAVGGMGVVYRARHKGLPNLHQAVKVLAPGYAADPAARARFKCEAAAAAQAGSHHQIVRPIDTGEFPDGSPYMLMELVEGKSLQQELAERHSLPFATAADIALLIADAMVHAHRQGIIHRDLKPANIMIEGGEGKQRVKILDFGIAKAGQSLPDEYVTEAGIAVGTVGYMSPEQTAGMPTDGRTDVFSWGVLFFQMLTGRLPFVANDRKALLAQVASPACRAPTVNSLCNGESEPISAEIEELIARALAKEAGERPTMAAVHDDLSRILAASTIAPAQRSASEPPRSHRRAAESPLLLPGGTAPSSSVRVALAEPLPEDAKRPSRMAGLPALVAPRSMLRTVLLAMILAAMVASSALFLGQETLCMRKREPLPMNATTSMPRVQVLTQQRTVDLREWKLVPRTQLNEKYSKIVFEDRYTVRRLSSESRWLFARHSTSASIPPEVSSDTHPLEITETKEKPLLGRPLMQKFDIFVDITREQLMIDFGLDLRAVYWNAINDPHRPWAALPIMEPTDAFTMRVIFPPDSTWAEYEFLAYERVGQAYDKPYTGKADVLFAADRSWIEWRVEHPNLNWVYKIVWKWKHR